MYKSSHYNSNVSKVYRHCPTCHPLWNCNILDTLGQTPLLRNILLVALVSGCCLSRSLLLAFCAGSGFLDLSMGDARTVASNDPGTIFLQEPGI